jgi:hypothetical protein
MTAAPGKWTVSVDRRGGGTYHCTFTSPAWPRGGEPGAPLYVKVTASRGWFALVASDDPDRGIQRDLSLADALALLPPSLCEAAQEAHAQATEAIRAQAFKWQARWMRARREAKEARELLPVGSLRA